MFHIFYIQKNLFIGDGGVNVIYGNSLAISWYLSLTIATKVWNVYLVKNYSNPKLFLNIDICIN